MFPVSDTTRIVLAPNCSLSPRGARWFFGSLCAGTLAIALPLTVMGYWPVLPFAGLELGLLWWALRASMARRDHRQIITVTDETVAIEDSEPPKFERVVFPRHWAQVRIRGGGSPLQPTRLTVGSHGRHHEIGSFLNEQERLGLADKLKRLIGRVNESPPLSLGGPA
jgi:uncharacterized membrane protein